MDSRCSSEKLLKTSSMTLFSSLCSDQTCTSNGREYHTAMESFLSSAGWLTVSFGVKIQGLLGKEISFEKEGGGFVSDRDKAA